MRTLANGRIQLIWLTSKPADPEAVTLAEADAGVHIEGSVLKSDYRLSATGSDTVDDSVLSAENNATTFSSSNYEGTITVLRELDAAGAPDASDTAFDTLGTKGTFGYLLEVQGPKSSAALAADMEYSLYEVITDDPQKPSDFGGYIKRTIPLGVQEAWEHHALVA